jgi:hypothetical protein
MMSNLDVEIEAIKKARKRSLSDTWEETGTKVSNSITQQRRSATN